MVLRDSKNASIFFDAHGPTLRSLTLVGWDFGDIVDSLPKLTPALKSLCLSRSDDVERLLYIFRYTKIRDLWLAGSFFDNGDDAIFQAITERSAFVCERSYVKQLVSKMFGATEKVLTQIVLQNRPQVLKLGLEWSCQFTAVEGLGQQH